MIVSVMQKQIPQLNLINRQELLNIAQDSRWEIFAGSSKSYTKYIQLPSIFGQFQQLTPFEVSFCKISYIQEGKVDIGPFIHQSYHFSRLTQLSINQCFLTSVQFITKLNSPVLEQLYLNQNFITQGSPLRKCHFPVLKILSISENPIVEGRWLSQIYLSESFQTLDMEACDNPSIIENMSYIAKINKTPRKIYCESENRISNKRMVKLLENRANQAMKTFKIYLYKTHGAM